MVKVVDDREAAAKKEKRESEARELVAKKKGGKNKKDDTQYEIEAVVGHELGSKSKKVIRLRIKRVGYAQTILESVKATKETAWVMVEEYGKKKNIAI